MDLSQRSIAYSNISSLSIYKSSSVFLCEHYDSTRNLGIPHRPLVLNLNSLENYSNYNDSDFISSLNM